VKTYEKAPDPPPTSSIFEAPSSETEPAIRLSSAFAVATEPLCCARVYVAATSGSLNHDAYDGASPVFMTSVSAPIRW